MNADISILDRSMILGLPFCVFAGYSVLIYAITEVTKSQSQRNRRRQRDFSEKFYVRGLENSCKAVDLLAQKLLNDMTLDSYPLMNSSLYTRQG